MADNGLGQRHPQPLERRHLLRVRRAAAAQDDVHHDADHPLAFAAQDNGITPVEYVLVALGGAYRHRAIAQHRKIQLRSVQATVEADEDLHGILGADPQIRNGFTGVRVSYKIDADATAEQVKALVAQSQKRSAVYDILTNPTPSPSTCPDDAEDNHPWWAPVTADWP